MAKVLVVEDDKGIAIILREYLKHAGHEVHLAAHGRQGLEETQTGWPEIVVMDLMMPVMDGFECLKKIRELPQNGALPVIMCSAVVDEATRKRLSDAGMSAFFSKDDRLAGIVEAVNKQLEEKT